MVAVRGSVEVTRQAGLKGDMALLTLSSYAYYVGGCIYTLRDISFLRQTSRGPPVHSGQARNVYSEMIHGKPAYVVEELLSKFSGEVLRCREILLYILANVVEIVVVIVRTRKKAEEGTHTPSTYRRCDVIL